MKCQTRERESTYAALTDVKTCININGSFQAEKELPKFLGRHDLDSKDIDLLITGVNGDCNQDAVYTNFADTFFPGMAQAWYKHLCGEYHTATGFGLYIAANILKHQVYPEILHLNPVNPSRLKNILIYNHFRNTNHSFMLIQGC